MIRTGYSFRTAVGKLDEVISRLQEVGSTVAPIADRNSTFGFNRWTKAATKAGLRPIYGVELAVTPALGEKKPVLDYWTFLAIDRLRPLHDLIFLATSNAGREPSLTYKQALEATGVVRIAGERAILDAIPEPSLVWMALSPATPRGLYRQAKERGFSFAARSANVYPREADREFYRVTLGGRASTQTYPQHITSEEEWARAVAFADAETRAVAIQNRDNIYEACRATLKKATLLRPQKPKTLRQMCEEGAVNLGVNLQDPVYRSRLDRELALIDEKQFEDYFYIIADMVAWAKQHMIVGPARGSSCGSLVCYLTGITAVDPIPFKLLFERFIDTTRADLPDIDLDFSDVRRQMVFDYAEKKYGRERVARLGTVGLFKPRSVLAQAGKALRIPGWRTNQVLDSLILRSSGDSRALQQLEDTLKDTDAGRALLDAHPEVLIASNMEGHPNNPSQHAAGIVITEEPVTEYVAVDRRTKATMCDKKDAEDLNLLKIDALGLTQLSVFERTLQLIGKPDRSGWLETIPFNDQAAFDVINKGHFAGIFQFMGGALQSLAKQVTVSQLSDIVAITALARPGPLATGGANAWVRRKNGQEPVEYPHPLFEPYLKDTLGTVIYQEQVMEIGRQIGDLSWEDVTQLRKAMSRSLGKEFFNRYGDPWKKAAIAKGIPENVVNEVWDDLCAYGSWSFNLSHAVAYGIVSYWCCYLKAHHPVEFAAATLDAETDPAKQIKLLRELKGEGVDYIPVDPEHSTNLWVPATKDGRRVLVGPLTSVKGIGPAGVQEIMNARERGEPIKPKQKKLLLNAKTEIDSLYPVSDRIKELHPDLTAINIFTPPHRIIEVQTGIRGDVVIMAVARRIVPRDYNEAVLVAKRGREMRGETRFMNLFFMDDSDEVYCKIDRWDYERLALPILERGRAGKAIYAVKGTVPPDFRMIKVKMIRYLGDMVEATRQ
jgi:DNA polymerase III alpha subunit